MLLSISIKNYLHIQQLEVNFKEGFNIIVGETGSGKTAILESLLFCFGAKFSSSNARKEGMSVFAAQFDIANFLNIQQALEDADIQAEDFLTFRRVIDVNSRSKYYINDMPVSLNSINKFRDLLIEYTGQHANIKLLSNSNHIKILDDFSHLKSNLYDLRNIFQIYVTLKKDYNVLIQKKENAEIELEYIKHAISEIEELDLQENEEDLLIEQRQILQQLDKITNAAKNVQGIIDSSNLTSKIGQIEKELAKAGDFFNESLQIANEVYLKINELEESICKAISKLNVPQSSIDEIDDRIHQIRFIARKYQTNPSQLHEKLLSFKQASFDFENIEQDIAKLQAELSKVKSVYLQEAKEISAIRIKEAANLTNEIKNSLEKLLMHKAEFIVKIDAIVNEDAWTESGIDRVKFQIKTNPEFDFDDIANVASGGELSRIMLAIQSAIALKNSELGGLIIFDEIDSGLSGDAAIAIGDSLCDLSKAMQIICISHQPQVVAKAHHHIQIRKIHGENLMVQASSIEGEDIVLYIANMISGSNNEEALNIARILRGRHYDQYQDKESRECI